MSYLVKPSMAASYKQRWGETRIQQIEGQKAHASLFEEYMILPS